jgi:RNA polymerase sigma-70 factor (ECF subfamily)
VDATPEPKNAGIDATPGTLGEVLYRGCSKGAAPEREWVDLVRAVGGGDQVALHALYDRAHRLVFTLMMRITGNRETAEELTLDVFHDVWRHASRYDPVNGTVLGWIMNQARSRAIDRLRFDGRKKRMDPRAMDFPREEVAPLHDALEAAERNRGLHGAVADLPAAERQAVQAAFFLDLTHAEVAARLREPLGTIKTRIRSGLRKLRKLRLAFAEKAESS